MQRAGLAAAGHLRAGALPVGAWGRVGGRATSAGLLCKSDFGRLRIGFYFSTNIGAPLGNDRSAFNSEVAEAEELLRFKS